MGFSAEQVTSPLDPTSRPGMRHPGRMFHHTVLLRFRPDSTREQHQAVVDDLRALPEAISELADYQVHLDAGLADDNAHVSVAATFADEAAWRSYAIHPAHLRVIDERINPIKESSLRSQYWS